MSDVHEVEYNVAIPRGAGIDGLLRAIKEVMTTKSRVQELVVTPGKLKYRCFEREGDPQGIEISYDDLLPYTAIRNGQVDEVKVQDDDDPLQVFRRLFERATMQKLVPIALVVGPGTFMWKWLGVTDVLGELFGTRVIEDTNLDESAVVLCTAYGRTESFLDVRQSFKITIPPAVLWEKNE